MNTARRYIAVVAEWLVLSIQPLTGAQLEITRTYVAAFIDSHLRR